ncbi:hypothetical protein [Nonomuraea typhae]|uniref:hypothetical protein n=1 Tax=Nonomuraea typhae TaxID=2603600 RepID=UPI0012F815C7|nr:hypothetical protein [Nonomuraea typhae]
MKALLSFLRGDPLGGPGDGRALGIGLTAALRKQYSAEAADHYLELWADEVIHKSPRA